MTPDRRQWIETVTAAWAARAAALRHDAHTSAGMRAIVLQGIVARLRAEIPPAVDDAPIAPIAAPGDAQTVEADRLEGHPRGPARPIPTSDGQRHDQRRAVPGQCLPPASLPDRRAARPASAGDDLRAKRTARRGRTGHACPFYATP